MKRRHCIIDGYQVIRFLPSLQGTLTHHATTAREEFIQLCATFALEQNIRCTIIFEGTAEHHHLPVSIPAPVHVTFSHPLRTDDAMRAAIDRSKQRTPPVIISSDPHIIRYAKTFSCETHSPRHFANLLSSLKGQATEKSTDPLSPAQIREWLKIFGE